MELKVEKKVKTKVPGLLWKKLDGLMDDLSQSSHEGDDGF